MSRGKQATGKFASSSSSSGYQNDNGDNDDNDDNDSMSANAIESAHFGQSTTKATKSKSKSSGKGKLIKGEKDDEAAAEEDEEQEQEQEQEQEEEQHEDEDQEEDEEGQQQEKMSVLTGGAVDGAEENEENDQLVSVLKARMLQLSRGSAAEGGLPNPKKQKLETNAGTAEKTDSDGRSGTTTTKGKDKYSGRNRNTQKDAAAAALKELSNVMKNPVVVAHEIVDKDAKKYKFSSRECYDIKKLLGDKSKAVVFIGLTAEERGFWYEDEGYGAKT